LGGLGGYAFLEPGGKKKKKRKKEKKKGVFRT